MEHTESNNHSAVHILKKYFHCTFTYNWTHHPHLYCNGFSLVVECSQCYMTVACYPHCRSLGMSPGHRQHCCLACRNTYRCIHPMYIIIVVFIGHLVPPDSSAYSKTSTFAEEGQHNTTLPQSPNSFLLICCLWIGKFVSGDTICSVHSPGTDLLTLWHKGN